MKKTILALAATSVLALASDTTVSATMGLMSQGLNQVQSGFMHNSREDILNGISIIENAKAIFNKVDVTTFIPNNNKVQVTKNINHNLTVDLNELRRNIENKKYSDATKSYSKVMNDCMSCHTIIRGW